VVNIIVISRFSPIISPDSKTRSGSKPSKCSLETSQLLGLWLVSSLVVSYSFNALKTTTPVVAIIDVARGIEVGYRYFPQESKVGRKLTSEPYRETGTKRHLWPLDTFSGLLVHPKCL